MQRIFAERHANLVPHRADDVVGGQKREEIANEATRAATSCGSTLTMRRNRDFVAAGAGFCVAIGSVQDFGGSLWPRLVDYLDGAAKDAMLQRNED